MRRSIACSRSRCTSNPGPQVQESPAGPGSAGLFFWAPGSNGKVASARAGSNGPELLPSSQVVVGIFRNRRGAMATARRVGYKKPAATGKWGKRRKICRPSAGEAGRAEPIPKRSAVRIHKKTQTDVVSCTDAGAFFSHHGNDDARIKLRWHQWQRLTCHVMRDSPPEDLSRPYGRVFFGKDKVPGSGLRGEWPVIPGCRRLRKRWRPTSTSRWYRHDRRPHG